MAILMELRCDSHSSGSCYSNRNVGLTELAGSTRRSQECTIRDLELDAVKHGWERRKQPDGYRLICPACRVTRGPDTRTIQQRILDHLAGSIPSVTERSATRIARALSLSPASVSATLKLMTTEGIVTRQAEGGPRGGYVYFIPEKV